jgi:glycosyltransferase involved in cell wall biosynthesis
MRILIDGLRLGRTLSGIERFARLMIAFLGERREVALRVYRIDRLALLHHLLLFPLAAVVSRAEWVVLPLFPPSPLLLLRRSRIVLLVHDLFYLDNAAQLNWRARCYLRPCFVLALKFVRHYCVNSEYTRELLLRRVDRERVEVTLLRPTVGNVFGLAPMSRRLDPGAAVELLAIGTVEPRKNYGYAVAIVEELREQGIEATLTIVGRRGWADADSLARPYVTLRHGVADAEMTALIDRAHFLIATSTAEGLGLPPLEVQHGGLPTVASDIPAFRETLHEGAVFVPLGEAARAAAAVADVIRSPARYAALCRDAAGNVARWNERVRRDWDAFARTLEGGRRAGTAPRPRLPAGSIEQDNGAG